MKKQEKSLEKAKKYVCEECGKVCQNPQALKNHVKLKHSEEEEAKREVKESLEDSKEELDLDIPEEETVTAAKPEAKAEDQEEYGCSECQSHVKYGENPCHTCGAELVWE